MSTPSKLVLGVILAMLVVALGSYSIIQVKAQNGAGEEEKSQKAMQTAHCKELKEKMATDASAAAQYKSKDCEGLLTGVRP